MDPLDEYPIHQVAMSMRHVATSDRNVYDRCIYQGQDHTGESYLITGLGVYPNLGVIDAYAAVRRGDTQWCVRTSGVRPDDKLKQQVGPYRIEVLEPFRRLRLVCDGDDFGVGFDLEFESDYGPIEEPQHLRRHGDKVLLDACRFAQVGTWSGELRVDGKTTDVTPDRWTATRDRSWGIRPVGEPDPPGRPVPFEGMWWCWVPLRFEDFAVHVILEEAPTGHRTTNFAVRVWPHETGRQLEQLGWPETDITYRSGTRRPEHATIHLTTRDRKPLTIEIDPRTDIPLNVGCGYGADPDWTHGVWKGEQWVEGAVYDHNDPAVSGRAQFSIADHLAHATCDGQEGWGIFEHGNIGRHDPSGFADYTSVAP
jgi:hypothetical protein